MSPYDHQIPIENSQLFISQEYFNIFTQIAQETAPWFQLDCDKISYEWKYLE